MADQRISPDRFPIKARVRQGVGALLLAAVASCAGRAPQPVAVVQMQDRYANCTAIWAEVNANNQRISELGSEQGAKLTQNVVAGVAGLVIPILWFGMDFRGAAGKEVDALNSRQQYLATLAEQRNCGATAPVPVAASPQAAAPAAQSPLPPPVAPVPPSTPAASPPVPDVVLNPTAAPSNEYQNYEAAMRQYEQAQQLYQSELRASGGGIQP
jgi:hypothetical protein